MEWGSITKCKAKAGYVFQPKHKLNLKLMNLEVPFNILARTPAVIVLDIENVQVHLYETGKLLVLSEEPHSIANKVVKCLE